MVEFTIIFRRPFQIVGWGHFIKAITMCGSPKKPTRVAIYSTFRFYYRPYTGAQ